MWYSPGPHTDHLEGSWWHSWGEEWHLLLLRIYFIRVLKCKEYFYFCVGPAKSTSKNKQKTSQEYLYLILTLLNSFSKIREGEEIAAVPKYPWTLGASDWGRPLTGKDPSAIPFCAY